MILEVVLPREWVCCGRLPHAVKLGLVEHRATETRLAATIVCHVKRYEVVILTRQEFGLLLTVLAKSQHQST
jgi:hypothetical protein